MFTYNWITSSCPNCYTDYTGNTAHCEACGIDTEQQKPIHEHDCNRCIFLGNYNGEDLYFCPGVKYESTIISRSGIDGDYGSGLCFANRSENLGEAALRAYTLGLLDHGEFATLGGYYPKKYYTKYRY